jgi:hypothetical protein
MTSDDTSDDLLMTSWWPPDDLLMTLWWPLMVAADLWWPQGLLAKKRTNLEMVLNTEDEYPLLIASAVRWRLAEEMRKRRWWAADCH